MLNLLKRLKSGPETAASLRAALAEVETAIPAATTALADAEAERAGLLLCGNDAQVLAAEANIATARIAQDRLHAAQRELARRAAEAESAEFIAGLDAQRAAVEKRAVAFARALPARYDALAKPLADLMNELVEIDAEVRRVNEADIDAARDGRIEPRIALTLIEHRANTHRDSLVFFAGSWLAFTSILASENQPGFGRGREVMMQAGIVAAPASEAA